MIKLVVGIVVGVTLFAALLMPIIGGAQATAGDVITKTNVSLSDQYCDYYTDDVEIIVSSASDAASMSAGNVTVNGEALTLTGRGLSVPIVFTEMLYAELSPSNNSSQMGTYRIYIEGATAVNGTFSFGHTYSISYDASAGKVTMTDTDSSNVTTTVLDAVAIPYFFAVDLDGDYSLMKQTAGSAVSSFDKMFVTPASVENGTVGVFRVLANVVSGSDTVPIICVVTKYGVECWTSLSSYTVTGEVNYSDLEVAEGTTNILTGGAVTVTLTVTNVNTEEVVTSEQTPDTGWVLNKATGYSTEGSMYDLLGVIPILFIVALIVGIAGVAFRRIE